MRFNFLASPKHCFFVVAALCLLCLSFSQQRLVAAENSNLAVTVPFTDTRTDAFYRPHQLVAITVQANKLSLPVSATFLFDTGSTHCAISASLAAKLGLPQHPLKDAFGNMLQLDGKTAVGVTVEQMNIGLYQVTDVPINILPDEQLTQALGQQVDGVLGSDVWQSLAVHLDFTKNNLTFVASKNPIAYSELASTATNLTPHDIEQFGFSKALVVPLIHDRYTYSAWFELKNGTKSETENLLIDTGTPLTAISRRAADLLGLEPALKVSYKGIKSFDVNVSWLSSLHHGDLTATDLLVASPRDHTPGFVPRLGLDVLANYDILLDLPHLKMYLKPRLDIQSVTCRQYEAASSSQRRQWAQGQLTVIYPTLDDSYVIPYDATSGGLPLAQVHPDSLTPVSFLLKSDANGILISETLAKQWHLKPEPVLDDTGKPRLLDGWPVGSATVSSFHISGATAQGQLAVLSDKRISSLASHLPVQGIVGANFIFLHPVLMNPTTQSWILLNRLHLEDLPSMEMANAAVVDILDPDGDGIPALSIQVQQNKAQFTDTLTLATGSPFTLLSVKAAQALKLTPETHKLIYGAGKDITVFNQSHLSQLSIGGVVLKDVLVAYPIGAMPKDFYPRLGMNVISQLRLLVDAPAKKMYIKKVGN